jgi:hypothetical protein
MGEQACCPDCGQPVAKPATRKDKVKHGKCKQKDDGKKGD